MPFGIAAFCNPMLLPPGPIVFAGTITCCENPREVMSYLPEVRPNWFFAVPRIWEKLKAGLETMLHSQPEEQRAKMDRALDAAREKVRLEQAGKEVPAELAEEVAAADEEMFAGLRKMLGLDDVITINVGAAPTPVEVLEFFHAIGLELAELYGMSESTGAGTCNRPGEVKIGTVGPAAPGCEIKLADDGEVLIRGPQIMKGYRNLPDQTADAIDADGWLHTGDIGELDGDGFLRITDRKKDLIVTAGGKNIAPGPIEAAMMQDPLVLRATVIGDQRKYLVALVVPEFNTLRDWARQNGVTATSDAELAADERVQRLYQGIAERASAKLARYETIKKVAVLDRDLSEERGELTPTLKVKRKVVQQNFAQVIDKLYA